MAEHPPFTTVSQHQQPSSGGSGTVKEAQTLPLSRPQHVIFEGKLGSGSSFQRKTVEVLAGEAAPTPSAGYAKWARVPRPQRVALTILEGYEPFTLTVPVLFDAVREFDISEREDVELQIQKLEWMGGRGIAYREPFQQGVGKPPLVHIFSSTSPGNPSQLVPKPFQAIKGVEGHKLYWYIEDIIFDEHPLRDRGGARLRQAAVVKLLEAVTDDPPPPTGSTSTPYKTTHSLNTVKKLVNHYMSPFLKEKGKLGEAVHKTLAINQGNKKIGWNPEKPLSSPPNKATTVKIPNEFL